MDLRHTYISPTSPGCQSEFSLATPVNWLRPCQIEEGMKFDRGTPFFKNLDLQKTAQGSSEAKKIVIKKRDSTKGSQVKFSAEISH